MLTIHIPAYEGWDERNQEFITVREQTIQLEHSLISLSKWEAKWVKPFLSKNDKTNDELLDYIKCMTITQNVKPEVYLGLTDDIFKTIKDYIAAPMTATWFTDTKPSASNGKQITSELIYYWMISLNIPFECQKWHLNRLLTLIKVCNIESQPPKKYGKREAMSKQAALNASRRAQLNSKG